jgi:hypothetical protein
VWGKKTQRGGGQPEPPPHTIWVLICPDTGGYSYNSQKWCHTFVNWYRNPLGQIKTKKMNGGAKRRHSSFWF